MGQSQHCREQPCCSEETAVEVKVETMPALPSGDQVMVDSAPVRVAIPTKAIRRAMLPELFPNIAETQVIVEELEARPPRSRERGFSARSTEPGLEERTGVEFNGGSYRGQWKKDAPHGHGSLVSADGCEYVGQFFDGKAHGEGVLASLVGAKYEGQFQNDEFSGDGVLLDVDGSLYEGQFLNVQHHGRGRQQWPDGVKFDGHFRGGVRHGKGCYFHADGSPAYVGEFKDDLMHGHGKYLYEDGVSYEGQWSSGFPHGDGVVMYQDGSLFAGRFSEGKRVRLSVPVSTNGRPHAGQSLNGTEHVHRISVNSGGTDSSEKQLGSAVGESTAAPAIRP